MRPLDPRQRSVAIWTLLVARAVYAFNWYDIGGVLPLVGERFAVGTVGQGTILASFLIGAAVFQLPAGYAAMRWGARSTSIVALGAMGVCALGSAVAPNWVALAAFRFGVGAGAAFFFAPALGLVTAYYPSGRRGFVIGAYNGAFSVGSGIGLFVSAYIGSATGWALPLALGGAMLVAVGVASALLLPSVERPARNSARELWARSKPVLRSRALWAMALGGSGLWGGFYIAAQYFVTFAHQVHPSWGLALAAAAPTVMIGLEVPGGPLGGWLGERARDMRRGLIAWGVVAGLLLALVPFLPLGAALGAFAVLGFADGVTFALLYLIPTYFPELRGEVMALGLALENFVQILIGSALALGFAFVAATYGYSAGWLFAGLASVAFLPALALVTGTGGARHSARRVGDPGGPSAT